MKDFMLSLQQYFNKSPNGATRSSRIPGLPGPYLKAALIFLLASPAAARASSAENADDNALKNVLILNSYHIGYVWTNDITEGISDVLKDQPLNLVYEYMDTKRYFSEEYEKDLFLFYKNKYKDTSFDLIISADDNALNFLKEYREQLFRKTPVVFCGVNDFNPSDLDGYSSYTGINENIEVDTNIALIMKIHPDTKRVIAICDSTTTGRKIRNEIARMACKYSGTLEFSYKEYASVEEILTDVREAGPDDVILYTTFLKDELGNFYENHAVESIISKESRIPLYGTGDHLMNQGIVGGRVVRAYNQGYYAAQTALKILNGADVHTIPVMMQSPNSYMFDYNELLRFNIDLKQVPEERIIINKPPDIIEVFNANRSYFLTLISIGLLVIVFTITIAMIKTKQSSKRVKESEEFYKAIFENSGSSMIIIEGDKTITMVNHNFAEATGLPKEQIVGKMNIMDFIAPDDRERVVYYLENKRTGSNAQKICECNLIDTNNVIKDFIITTELIPGTAKTVAALNDITERKANEEALQEKDRLLHDVETQAKIGGWKVDLETDRSINTDEVARIYDLEHKDAVNVEIGLSFYCADSRKRIEEAFYKLSQEGTPYDLELEIISAKGNHKWVHTTGYPVMKEGRIAVVQGILQDITKIKQAETRLKESERKYRTLIELAPLGIGVINNENKIIDLNQALASMLGYEIEDLLGLDVKKYIHPDDLQREKILLQDLKNDQKTSYSIEKRLKRKNGDYFWTSHTIAKLENIYGPEFVYFGFAADITDRKQMEKEREQLISDLKNALAEIKELRGYIPICANCKKVRDDDGFWQQVDEYISERTGAEFSHGLCPDCMKKLYPDMYDEIKDDE